MPKDSLVVLDVERPYLRKGLLYVPIEVLTGTKTLVVAPHIALQGAHMVLDAVSGKVLAFGRRQKRDGAPDH